MSVVLSRNGKGRRLPRLAAERGSGSTASALRDDFRAGGCRALTAQQLAIFFQVIDAMKKIDLSIVPAESGGTYPSPFDEPCRAQLCQRIARYAGLSQFGVNVTV